MTHIVAVSGGVDSVVLLHMFAKEHQDIIVAHVDHGIRDDSADDARFVRALAQLYGYPYKEERLALGQNASEELAREKRYGFLQAVAEHYGGEIVTAHHANDMVETVAINLERGTGWRGLTVLNREGVIRPLLRYTKSELYRYAMDHHLEWVEDKTNRDLRYLRNAIRARLHGRISPEAHKELEQLRERQIVLSLEVATEARRLLQANGLSRYFFGQVDTESGIELLGSAIRETRSVRPVRAQLERALLANKTARPGTTHHVGSGVSLRFSSRVFSVEVV